MVCGLDRCLLVSRNILPVFRNGVNGKVWRVHLIKARPKPVVQASEDMLAVQLTKISIHNENRTLLLDMSKHAW